MCWTTLLHEQKPVFKEELKKIIYITIGALTVVTLVQIVVSFDRMSSLRVLFFMILVNLIMSFSITSSAVFTGCYFTERITRKLNFTFRLIISFLAMVGSLIIGIHLGQLLVWLMGILNDPYFLDREEFWLSFVFSVIVAIVVTIYYGLKEKLEVAYQKIRIQERQKSELEILKAKAELEALQSKINPHFLFNALNSIAGLASIAPEKVEGTILKLAELFRSNLKEYDSDSSIEEEIGLIKNYLDLEKIRFGKRLNYTIEIDEKLKTMKIPRLLIQPIVENAIKHGIEPQPAGGTIRIFVQKIEGQSKIIVKDDGAGINGDISFGYGLSNIQKRLQNLYSDKYSFDIESENGTTVSITIPTQ